MIERLIQWSVHNRVFVLLCSVMLIFGGLYSVARTPVDAIPDLSDVQVIIHTRFPGQAPQVVEDQVTYPLTSAMLAVPGASTVRGFSFYGDSYVYVIFDENTDLYWARSRVLEYLNQASLPETARPRLGPDATGVGWVFIYALRDESGTRSLADLRSLQDWFLKYELQTVPGVAEVATLGGMVKQYQIVADPNRLRAYNIPLTHLEQAVRRGNQEVGASVVEMAEAEYMVRATGYIKDARDLEALPLGVSNMGVPLTVKDVAEVRLGPQMRRGIGELNGEGETVGGIVVMRSGENAATVIDAIKTKLAAITTSLPEGIEIVPVYDRSTLIHRAVQNLWLKVLEELALVAIVCVVFLLHVRSALVAVISIPLGILLAFIAMRWQGLNANIMSLGGIAIAIGTMVDGAIVMVENLHKHYARTPPTSANRWQTVIKSSAEVGPALFFSLLIITVSFMPVFTLEAQEGRLFKPLAFTKTYAMAAAAILAVTLVPVLLGYFVRGRIRSEQQNPVQRVLVAGYRPLLALVLQKPWLTLALTVVLGASAVWPASRIGSEFMPDMDEGDLMYMPTTYPGISIGKAREILQQTDKLLMTVPEVATVFGKIGRADTATDPAPLTMIETFIQLKPRELWREGMTTAKLKAEFDNLVQIPGLTNAWVMPIKTRIDMLATGIKTPVGIKLAGPDLSQLQALGVQVENILQKVPDTASVYAERASLGRYLQIDIDRFKAARYQMNVADIQQVVATAIGGANIAQSIEGRERYPINLRYPQHYRDSPEVLKQLPMVTPQGAHITLGDVADISLASGPAMLKSENARLNSWVFVDIENVDLGRYVTAAREALAAELNLPQGYALNFAGQYEYMERAKNRLSVIVPLTLGLVVILLYLNFAKLRPVVMLLTTLPFALVGSLWLMYWLNFNFSIAAGVGFIALAGVAAETGVIMLVYLDQARRECFTLGIAEHSEAWRKQIIQAAAERVRPVLMTAVATVIGLLPVLYGTGAGSEVMSRLAAPMVGGMITTILLTLLVLPVVYVLFSPKTTVEPN